MNILMIGPSTTSKGGISTVISNFKNKYKYKDNDIFFMDSWMENQRLKKSLQTFFKIRRKIQQEKIEIVHFHVAQKGSFYRKALLALYVHKDVKVIFHMHASQFDIFYKQSPLIVKKFIKYIFNKLDGLVVLSEEWAQFYYTITATKITIIENAVEIPEVINYDINSNKIITFGRVGRRKGSYDILKLAESIQGSYPNIRFILYGDGKLDEITKQLKKRKINNIILGGWINKEEQIIIMKTSVLHLLPSYHEGLPMSILETMAYGIPNLATMVGGIPQVVKDGINGLSVNPGDIGAMETKLSLFLDNDKIRKKLSNEAFNTIKSQFSLNEYFEKWNFFYDSIMKSEKR